MWECLYNLHFYVSHERIFPFICFKLAAPSFFWEAMNNLTPIHHFIGLYFTCTCNPPHTSDHTCGPSWLCFCIFYEKSNQNSSAVFKKWDLHTDQEGDFHLLSSSFSIKCKYSTCISDWHWPLNWCPQGAIQVIPCHIFVFKSKCNQHIQFTMIYGYWEDVIYISVIPKPS